MQQAYPNLSYVNSYEKLSTEKIGGPRVNTVRPTLSYNCVVVVVVVVVVAVACSTVS